MEATDNTKFYDGTTSAAAVPTVVSGTLAAGDTSLFTESYTTADEGTGLTLVPTGTVEDGNGGANYDITFENADDGVIRPAVLTATIIGNPTKTYDGTTTVTLSAANFSLSGLVGTDSFTVTQTSGTYNSADVTAATTVTASLSASDFTPGSGTLASNYMLPTTATGAGSITPAALTASIVGDPTKIYDGTTTATLAAANFHLSGLVGSDSFTVTQTTGTYNSKNVPSATTVTASLAADDFTPASGTLASNYTLAATASGPGTITPASLTVTANSVSAVYGSALPALTYTITGFASGDTASVVSGSPVLTTTAKAGSNAGAYPITVSAGSLSAANYIFPAADLKNGTLTITPALLTITAVSTTAQVGAPLPALSVVYSGLVNGDTPASLTTLPAVQTTATSTSSPGHYPITVSGASDANYQITYVPGTLTLVLPPATVESVSLEKFKVSKRKSVEGIVLQFSEALNAADAQSIRSYSLATVPKTKKQKSKPVALSTATYSPSAFTVTLLTRRPWC